ncbi:MAG: hypothetical protein PHP23_01070 [Desulfobacterales bacterium]|nr:hypothetical protein [Desulfobacterales bacterium]MDD4070992.1 hypothetical protein [Desulfobacterales bacterium]MDD4391905.1 hypothetical protein [Desulfobacterales bacterium]
MGWRQVNRNKPLTGPNQTARESEITGQLQKSFEHSAALDIITASSKHDSAHFSLYTISGFRQLKRQFILLTEIRMMGNNIAKPQQEVLRYG